MLIKMLVSKLKSFMLFFVNIIRKALCCFRRRRRLSNDAEPLMNIVVKKNNEDTDTWNDWEFMNKKPNSVQEHIEYYRQQQAKQLKQQQEPELGVDEDPVDLFGDMAPKITKQQKLLISERDKSRGYSLDARNEAADFMGNELENWEENTGWEKDAWDTDELLRQKKREERERRQWELHQKRLEKGNKPNVLGAKIAT